MKAFVTDFDPKEQQNQMQETCRPWISARAHVQILKGLNLSSFLATDV